MPFYLVTGLDGDGTRDNSYRIPQGLGVKRAGLWRLRGEGALARGIGYLSSQVVDPRLVRIADLATDAISLRQRNEISTALGVTLTADRFDRLVEELAVDTDILSTHQRMPLREGWASNVAIPVPDGPQMRSIRVEISGHVLFERNIRSARHRTEIINDGMSGASGNDLNGRTPDTTDNGNTWTGNANGWEVNGSGACFTNNGETDHIRINTGGANMLVTCDVIGPGSNYICEINAVQADHAADETVGDDRSVLNLNLNTDILKIAERKTGTSVTDLDSISSYGFNNSSTYDARHKVSGTSVTAGLGNLTDLSGTLTVITPGNFASLKEYTAVATYDNFKVDDLATFGAMPGSLGASGVGI